MIICRHISLVVDKQLVVNNYVSLLNKEITIKITLKLIKQQKLLSSYSLLKINNLN